MRSAKNCVRRERERERETLTSIAHMCRTGHISLVSGSSLVAFNGAGHTTRAISPSMVSITRLKGAPGPPSVHVFKALLSLDLSLLGRIEELILF